MQWKSGCPLSRTAWSLDTCPNTTARRTILRTEHDLPRDANTFAMRQSAVVTLTNDFVANHRSPAGHTTGWQHQRTARDPRPNNSGKIKTRRAERKLQATEATQEFNPCHPRSALMYETTPLPSRHFLELLETCKHARPQSRWRSTSQFPVQAI